MASTSPDIMRPGASRGALRQSGGSRRVLALVCVAQFMVVLDATVVNVALPSIQKSLHFSTITDLQWVVNAYSLVFGGLLLLGGRAADLFGRRRFFLIGMAVFTMASVLNGLAPTPGLMIAGRALQGLGGALVSPAALSIITTTFPPGRERGRALGVWSTVAAAGGGFGLVLGGLLTGALSWQWVFFINVPIGVITWALSLRHLPDTRAPRRSGGVDVIGAATVTGGLAALVYAIIEAQSAGWLGRTTLTGASLAVVLLGSFVMIERRVQHPLVRLEVLRDRSLAGADLVMLLASGGMFAVSFFATLYVQDVLGYRPLHAGLSLLPVTAGIMTGAAIAQRLMRRVGVHMAALVGVTMAAAGLLLLTRISTGGSYALDLLPALAIMSVGMGLTFTPITIVATTSLGASHAGLASGLLNTARQVGGALGLAILSTLATAQTAHTLSALRHAPTLADQSSALVNGFRTAFLAGAILLLIAWLLLALLVPRHRVGQVDAADRAPRTSDVHLEAAKAAREDTDMRVVGRN